MVYIITSNIKIIFFLPIYSNKNDNDFNTPFCTFNSGTRYSFINAGNTVNGEHVSATIAIAIVVHTRFWRSCTRKLFNNISNTSCGPNALAI